MPLNIVGRVEEVEILHKVELQDYSLSLKTKRVREVDLATVTVLTYRRSR